MKKIVQLLFCALAFNSASAQTLFSADFEDGTLGGMTIVDNDGHTPAPNVAAFADAWTVTGPNDINAGLTSNVLMSNSWYSPPAAADDWLITPQVTIEDENTAFVFDARAIDANYADGFEVRVSTTDAEVASFTDVILSIGAEVADGSFTLRSASLSEYVGKDIYVAIRNNSFDKFLLAVDNVSVRVIQARDVAVNTFTANRYQVKGEGVTVSAIITNEGAQPLTSVDLNWSDGFDTYTSTVDGLNLMTGQSTEISGADMFVPSEAITYDLTVWTSNPNGDTDLNEMNDMATGQVSGVSYIPSRRAVGEEGTGTWCGFCPRGTVALDYMEANYKEEFIGIAVHNGDPMVVSEYDTGLGITGFPGGKIDRSFDIDPGQFEAGFELIRSSVAPIAVTAAAVGDEDTRTITVTADAEFVTLLEDIDFRLSAVITEDGVTGTGSGYAQVNYYAGGSLGDLIDVNGVNWSERPDPIPASDMVYDHVARALLGGFDGMQGSVPSTVAEGEKVSRDFTWEVPMNMDMTKMHAAVFVIDNATGVILNAGKADVQLSVSTNEIIDESISAIYPNPASDVVYLDINLKESSDVTLQVMDMMGKVVTQANLGTLSGNNQRVYDVNRLTSGMYLFKITAGELVSTKKIMVAK